MTAIHITPRATSWSLCRLGIAESVAGLAAALIWLHLLDASILHPQHDTSLPKHLVLVALALAAPPIAFATYRGARRAWQAATALAVGLVALSSGAVIHVVAIVKNDQWVRSDVTGVAMTAAGISLLLLGLVLATLAIPRWRYRALMIPGALLAVSLVAFPVFAATYITHAPRRVIEPADLGATYSDVAFETADGLTLRGWYVPSANGAAIAVVHGSGGSRMGSLDHARMLIRHGYGVLVFDVRGHGESDGATSAVGWGASPDLAAAAAFLEARADARDASVPVTDLPSNFVFELMVTTLSGEHAPPGLTNLSPQISEPALYIASGDLAPERTIVSTIAERSGGEHDLWVIEGAGHVQGLDRFSDEYEARVVDFLDRWLLPD